MGKYNPGGGYLDVSYALGDWVVTAVDKAVGTIEITKNPKKAVYRTIDGTILAYPEDKLDNNFSHVTARTPSGKLVSMQMDPGVSWDEAMRTLEKAAENLSDAERKGYAKQAVKAVQNGYQAEEGLFRSYLRPPAKPASAKRAGATVAGVTQAIKSAYSPTAVKPNGDPSSTAQSTGQAKPNGDPPTAPSMPAASIKSAYSPTAVKPPYNPAIPSLPAGVAYKPSYPEAKAVGGCVCRRCNSKNPHAEPNQADGSYLCFECR